MKPPLTYYGGKQRLASTIIALLPKHTLFCEPFFGGGAVFFNKAPSEIEVINDTNRELINFYEVVKNDFIKLEYRIRTTLHSRMLHMEAETIFRHPTLFGKTQRAWALWTLASQSYASKLNGSWGYDKKENRSAKVLYEKRLAFIERYAQRLEKIQIECVDALQVIKARDTKQSFFYCDPPYFNAHQGHYKGYTEQDFEALLQVLSKIKGKFLLSSYPSKLLSAYTKGHNWHTKKLNVSLSLSSNAKVKTKRKIEILTANYPLE